MRVVEIVAVVEAVADAIGSAVGREVAVVFVAMVVFAVVTIEHCLSAVAAIVAVNSPAVGHVKTMVVVIFVVVNVEAIVENHWPDQWLAVSLLRRCIYAVVGSSVSLLR